MPRPDQQETQLSLTNRATRRDQSRSPNMVPFDMLGIWFPIVCYSNFVPKTSRFSDIRLQKRPDLENRVMGP